MFYTGKGDSGTTKFFDTKSGERVSKGSSVAEALGSLDELNSFLGLIKACVRNTLDKNYLVNHEKIADLLEEIQENLFIIQAELAGAEKSIVEEKVKKLEIVTDAIETEIPKITGFSIAGQTEESAMFDVARTIARRAERQIVRVFENNEREIGNFTRSYLNRLSSILFAFARLANHRAGVKEKNPSYK